MRSINLLFLVFTFSFLISCSSDDDGGANDLYFRGTYHHEISGCTLELYGQEFPCGESLSFQEDGTVLYIEDGDDIMYQSEYTASSRNVEVKKNEQIENEFSFTIIDKNTLKSKQDGEIWIKQN